jgi:hypothetical protein
MWEWVINMADYTNLFRGLGLLATSADAFGQRNATIYNYKSAKLEAANQLQQASDALMRGQIDMLDHHIQRKIDMGSVKADAAARGVEVDSGSALDVTRSVDATATVEENRIEYNAYTEARNYRAQASTTMQNAKNAKKKGFADSVGTFLGGVGQYYKSGLKTGAGDN